MDNQTLTTLMMFGVLLVGGYFLMIRPQQKRAREQQDMIAKLEEGSRVMLTSGVFATIRHMGTKQAIVEVSPGVELTILRQAIVRAVPTEEEEFEYDDELAAHDTVPDDAADLTYPDSAWQRDAETEAYGVDDPTRPGAGAASTDLPATDLPASELPPRTDGTDGDRPADRR